MVDILENELVAKIDPVQVGYSEALLSSELLGDKEIRYWLKVRLSAAWPAPRAVLEELRVYNGNAIADVVAIHRDAHCYEIKSDKDSIERIQKQAHYYDPVFRKVTLVTTSKHLQRAEILVPPHWGIIVASPIKGKVIFSHVRPVGLNPHFNKQLALLTLWRSELTDLAEPISEIKLAKMNRQNLTELLANNYSAVKISEEISKQLSGRIQNLKSLTM